MRHSVWNLQVNMRSLKGSLPHLHEGALHRMCIVKLLQLRECTATDPMCICSSYCLFNARQGGGERRVANTTTCYAMYYLHVHHAVQCTARSVSMESMESVGDGWADARRPRTDTAPRPVVPVVDRRARARVEISDARRV